VEKHVKLTTTLDIIVYKTHARASAVQFVGRECRLSTAERLVREDVCSAQKLYTSLVDI